jgi:DNA-binding MarR family transcriptional regulator
MEQQGAFNQELARYLHKVVLMIDRTADRALRQNVDISLAQFLVLNNLGHNETGLSQQAIADLLGKDKAALSRHVTNLVERKLAVRALNPQSKREYALSLTAEGEMVLTRAKQVMRQAMTPHFLAAGETQARAMLAGLKAMHDSLEAKGKNS